MISVRHRDIVNNGITPFDWSNWASLPDKFGGRWIGIGGIPEWNLDVSGDVNIVDPGGASGYTYRINGIPIQTLEASWSGDVNANGFDLNNLGHLGIGEPANPNYAIDAIGDINITGQYLINGVPLTDIIAQEQLWQQGSGGAIYYSAGNVGIKNNSPQFSLDINGSVNVTGGFYIGGVLFAGTGTPYMAGLGKAIAHAAPTAPQAPQSGELWFNPTDHKLSVWYEGIWLGVQMA
jgi:hypothetical protein